MGVLVLCIHITQGMRSVIFLEIYLYYYWCDVCPCAMHTQNTGDEKRYIPRNIYVYIITDVMCVLVLCIHITQGMRSVIFLEIYIYYYWCDGCPGAMHTHNTGDEERYIPRNIFILLLMWCVSLCYAYTKHRGREALYS